MAFFLARAALCIGVVAAAASGVGTGRLATALDRGARNAVDGAGRACLASSDCLRIGGAALASAAGPVPSLGGRPSDPRAREPAPRGPDAKGMRARHPAGG